VILDVDSPGGEVFGVSEAANAIRAMRGGKPIVAVANPVMASAAYWLGSQADEAIAAPSSLVGSIGAFAVHVDESGALDKEGLKVTPVSYGRMKVSGASFAPLSDEAKASMQARVDYFGKLMETDIGKARRLSAASVHAQYGEGDIFTPPMAKQRGLVDRIATLEEVAGQLSKGRGLPAIPKAEHDGVEIAARAILAGLGDLN
jgi:signal peptide peptidase SppA